MKVKIGNIEFKNPIIAASGTFSNGREFDEYFDIARLGGICTTGITYNKRAGNKGRRIHEVASGLMNSIGLQNEGIEEFIANDLKFLEKKDTNIIANLGGGYLEEYLEGAKLLNKSSVDMIELNISCPNVKEGGMAFGIKTEDARHIVKEVRKLVSKPLIVKLSPNAENIKEMARACEEAGADGLSLVNTFNALAIDIYKREPIFENKTAGLSGPCIKPIALRMVWEVASVVDIPVIGIGGITNFEDVIEFIMAGASAVQIGSGNFIKPDLALDIIKDLESYMERENIKTLDEIRKII